MLSSNFNFKPANRLLQDMLMLTAIIRSMSQFVLHKHCSCTTGQIWAGHWHSSAQNQLHHERSFLLQVIRSWRVFASAQLCVQVPWWMCEPSANHIPRRLEIMSYAGVRLTSCGTSRASTAFLVSCTALILHVCTIDALCSNHRELAHIDTSPVPVEAQFKLENRKISHFVLRCVLLLKILTSVLWKLEFGTGIGNTNSAISQLEPRKTFLQDGNLGLVL